MRPSVVFGAAAVLLIVASIYYFWHAHTLREQSVCASVALQRLQDYQMKSRYNQVVRPKTSNKSDEKEITYLYSKEVDNTLQDIAREVRKTAQQEQPSAGGEYAQVVELLKEHDSQFLKGCRKELKKPVSECSVFTQDPVELQTCLEKHSSKITQFLNKL